MRARKPPLPLLLALLALVALGTRPVRGADHRPNILFILADDLGYGDLGCYGQKDVRTPNLDRLAAEGVRFTQFYAGAPVCAPSRCVLMTGLHTGHCRIRGNAKLSLHTEDVTVAEVLKTKGYATGLVGKWGLGGEGTPGVPTRVGFDHFFGYLDQTHAHNYFPTFLVRDEERVPLTNVVPNEGPLGQGVASKREQYSPDLMTAEALSFLERNRQAPFFLYLAYTLPHANNEAMQKGMEIPDYGEYADRDWPEPQKGTAAMISRLDRDIGRVLGRLRQLGLDRSTLVLFSSDNGPHREGGNDPDFFDSNGALRGIKRAVYEGGIRVPAIARWPGHAPAGKVSDYPGWFADFLPTAADLAGAKRPAGLDGHSLVPAIRGKAGSTRRDPLYWEFYEQGSSQAARLGNWKAVARPFGGPIELYDLKTDVAETRDVAAEHPKVVEKARRVMQRAHVPSPDWKAPGE